jgi:ABC-type Mn2+/Zn2+ transport system ATPase subunit
VGVAGAEGNGQRTLLRGIIGINRNGGSTSVDGKSLSRVTPASALGSGISLQSGDRAAESVFLPSSVICNAVYQLGSDAGPAGSALGSRLVPAFKKVATSLGIVAASPYQPISGLSGGNQQKAVLARPALRQPKVLIIDEPTQGVDARARIDIYREVAEAAEDGIGVLVNSSDSAELAGICDRVYVMSRGVVVAELAAPTTESEIVRSFVAATDMTESQGTDAAETGGGFLHRLFRRVSAHVPIAVLLLLITLVAVYAGTQSPVFWTKTNLAILLILTLPLAFVAMGQQFAMMAGLFDISIGSTMSLTVVLMSMTLPDLGASSIAVTLAVLVLTVLAVGGFNSLLVVTLHVTPVVATVATLSIVQGVAILLRPEVGGVIAPDLVTLVALGIGFVPTCFIALVVIAVALEFWLHRRPGGTRAARGRLRQRLESAGRGACLLDPDRQSPPLCSWSRGRRRVPGQSDGYRLERGRLRLHTDVLRRRVPGWSGPHRRPGVVHRSRARRAVPGAAQQRDAAARHPGRLATEPLRADPGHRDRGIRHARPGAAPSGFLVRVQRLT